MFSKDRKGNISANYEMWSCGAEAEFVSEVLRKFNDKSAVMLELWPHWGQLIAWESSYKQQRNPNFVAVSIDEWMIGWNSIADSGSPESWVERELELYEKKLAESSLRVVANKLSELKAVTCFLCDEYEYII